MTAAERTKLETSDAAWVRPPQMLIDEWDLVFSLGKDKNNRFLGTAGKFNETTGYFEAYDSIKDIGTAEAMEIIRMYYKVGTPPYFIEPMRGLRRTVRTLPPITWGEYNGISHTPPYFSVFPDRGVQELQFINPGPDGQSWGNYTVSYINNCFCSTGLVNLATKYSPLDFSQIHDWNGFYSAQSLVNARVKGLHVDPKMGVCSKVSQETIRYMVTNRGGTNAFNFTVHKNVYRALMGEAEYPFNGGTEEEWAELLQLAQDKNITFISA